MLNQLEQHELLFVILKNTLGAFFVQYDKIYILDRYFNRLNINLH